MKEYKKQIAEEMKLEEQTEQELAQRKKELDDMIIDEGTVLDRLSKNDDFKFLMEKLESRVAEISGQQLSRLGNMEKIAKSKNTIDSIVGDAVQESLIAGEFMGLKTGTNIINTAIAKMNKILEKRRNEEKEEENE